MVIDDHINGQRFNITVKRTVPGRAEVLAHNLARPEHVISPSLSGSIENSAATIAAKHEEGTGVRIGHDKSPRRGIAP
jgi:hypothetical protein